MGKGRKRPEIRFKGFAEDWEESKFEDIFEGLQNNSVSRDNLNYNNGDTKNIHYGDVLIKFGEVIDVSDTELPYLNDESIAQKYAGSLLQDGDIVIADTAEDTTAGKCIEIQNIENLKVLSGLHTIPWRPKEKFAPKFMGYYLNSTVYHNQLIPLMQGTKVTSISKGALQKTAVLRPFSLIEQEKIGLLMCSIDKLINLQEQKYDGYLCVKKSMLKKMFPQNGEKKPEIRFKGFTEDWQQRKLFEIAEFCKGHGYSKGDVIDVGTPIILYGRLYTRYETTIKEVDTFVIPQNGSIYSKGGEVIVPASGETAEDIARAAAVKNAGIIFGGDLNIITPNEDINSAFLALSISNGEPKKELAKKAQGKSVVHIHNEEIKGLVVSFPCKKEQDLIDNYFSYIDNLITLHHRKLTHLKNIKKAMLEKMFV